MPSAYINGFSPITVEDSDIHVYDALTYASKTSKTIEIWQGKPDNNGLIKFEVPKPYIGKSIIIICIGTVSGYMSDTLNVTKLGAFHTVKLHGDRGLGLIDSDLSVPNNWYITSQSTIRHIYRNIK